MKKLSVPALLLLPQIICAQAKMEKPPSFEEYLTAENNIDLPSAVEAPQIELGLKGMRDDRPETRTSASLAEEVRSHQGRLTALYKAWKLKGKDAERYFGVAITISPGGDVLKVVATGLADREFKAKVEEAIMLWSFSPVKDKKPMQANLKHLDFLYRKELQLD